MYRSEKTCYACDTLKPIGEFALNRTKLDGHSDECRACKNAYLRERTRRIAERNMSLRMTVA